MSPPLPTKSQLPSQRPSIEQRSNFKMIAPTFKNDNLILYMHPYNFYSQKVLLILYEKNIDVQTYTVDMSNGEQYSSWFLSLNPKANVPVLQDGAFVVPDSRNIITYVENKFRGGDCLVLFPRDLGSKEYERIQFYEKLFTQLPVGALSLGSFIHDLKLNPKPPFIGPIRTACLENNAKIYDLLKQSIDDAETNKDALLAKLDLQDRRKTLVASRIQFQKILDHTFNILQYVEKDFQQNPNRVWLISDEYCMADVSLGLFLHRLHQLGYENYYWANGKLPHVDSYFERFKKRPAYQRLVPNSFEILKDIWQKTPNNYKIGASAGVLGMAVFAAFAHK